MSSWFVGAKQWIDRAMGWNSWMDLFNAWWLSLDFTFQVYWFIALLASLILFLQTILSLFGVGVEELDLGTDIDAASGMGALSFRSVNAFFVGFGWSGIIALQGGASLAVTVPISVLTGGAMMSIVYWLMRFFYGLHASGTVDYAVAIGNTARVDLPIPAGRNGSGQIEILLQGQLRVVSAFNNSEKPIPRNERVKVVGQVDGTTLLVEPLE